MAEATAINPPCGEAKTAQAMRQEIYEVFDGTSNQELKTTSETAELKLT